MTARQLFEGLLTELSKVNAPSMLLSEFNYYINKAINLYVNKRYNIYDVSLQTTDDLRVLKTTTVITDLTELVGENSTTGINSYILTMPSDYYHVLNCICIYEMLQNYKCYDKGNNVNKAAKRLTADSLSLILDDYYNRPSPELPYYYINNINLLNDLPTNAYLETKPGSNDQVWYGDEDTEGGFLSTVLEFPRKISLKNIILKDKDGNLEKDENGEIIKQDVEVSTIEKPAGLRHSNPSTVRCEILYGKDHSVYKLVKVRFDYIKTPLHIRLTLELMDYTQDKSQIMEFPDPVCLEIINELVLLVMEKTADPRLNTHTQVVLSIANPALLQPLQQLQRGQ